MFFKIVHCKKDIQIIYKFKYVMLGNAVKSRVFEIFENLIS